MKLEEENKRQVNWRNWDSYLDTLPIEKSQTIRDLGCGLGAVSKLLVKKSLKVIGIDLNEDLLIITEVENRLPNNEYFKGDLNASEAWENRFDSRMLLKEYSGKGNFLQIKTEFLDHLVNQNHKSETAIT